MWRILTDYGYIGQYESKEEAERYIREELNGEGIARYVDTPNYL